MGELGTFANTNLIQHCPTFLERRLVQHAFYPWPQTVDLDELYHQSVSGVEFGQLFWGCFAIGIKFPNLAVAVRRATHRKEIRTCSGVGRIGFNSDRNSCVQTFWSKEAILAAISSGLKFLTSLVKISTLHVK